MRDELRDIAETLSRANMGQLLKSASENLLESRAVLTAAVALNRSRINHCEIGRHCVPVACFVLSRYTHIITRISISSEFMFSRIVLRRLLGSICNNRSYRRVGISV